jgi:hypothetical protein
MTDVLDRLRAADPAPATVDPPPEELLARLVAQERRRPRSGRWRLLVPVAATGALAVAGVALIGGGQASIDLAERAYAQTAPADAVIHSIERTRLVHYDGDDEFRSTTRSERWLRGGRSHTILEVQQDGESHVFEQVVGADGVWRNRTPWGEIQAVRADDGGDSADLIRESRTDAVAAFRARFARDELRDAGETTFNGRRARAYVREGRHRTETFYLDADTARPLGMHLRSGSGNNHLAMETVLETFERLAPTPANLAKLRWSAR